jgi:ABC-type nitrate/sulfonate/bicarbonate transport system substrate-binding protein
VSRFARVPAALCLVLAVTIGCRSNSIDVQTSPPGAGVTINGERATAGASSFALKPGDNRLLVTCPAAPSASMAASASSVAPPPTGPLRVVRTAHIPLTAYLPLYVALDQHYFERLGVQAEVTEAASPNDILTGIVSGKVDFAAALAYSILLPGATSFPGKFKIYSGSEETSQHYTSSIIAKKGSDITTYQQLRGKRIGVYQGLVQVVFLKAMLTGMHIPLDDVKIIQISPRLQIQGLVSGEYDALSTTEPTANLARIQGVAQDVVQNPRMRFVMSPFPSTGAAISSEFATRDPEAAKAVVAALDLAIDYIHDHGDDAKRSLLKYTAIPAQYAEPVLADLKLFKFTKLGEENRLNVQRFADYLFDSKIVDKKVNDVNTLFGDYEDPPKK